MSTITFTGKEQLRQNAMGQPPWQRIALLVILVYEAAGCLLGGALLVAAPDGRYMDMPVELMRGVFPDFLIPGLILFALGILNSFAIVAVVRRANADWLITGFALGGLFIWFVVEIAILQELHWLHLMWGYPVLIGWAVAIPLIVLRNDTAALRKALLTCGILSAVWYVAINVFVPARYEGYDLFSMTVSELSAIGAPTRIIWVLLAMPYPLLLLFFGWAVLGSAGGSRNLQIAGSLIIVYSVFNFYWPPMHQRQVIAAGGGTLTDSMHIAWAVMTLIFNMLLMGFGAAACNKPFRWYTVSTWIIFIVFGILTFIASPGIEANLPTPYIGLWERINIAVFLLWLILFAINILRKNKSRQGHQAPDAVNDHKRFTKKNITF